MFYGHVVHLDVTGKILIDLGVDYDTSVCHAF